MQYFDISPIFVFGAFSVVGGLLTLYCFMVLIRSRRKLLLPNLSEPEIIRLRFTSLIMIIPLSAFGCEFMFFFSKFIQTLWSLIMR